AYTDEDFWERDVFLCIEILRQFLIAEHLIADQNALARINSTKPAAHQRSSAHRDVLATVVFQENQIVISKRHQPICFDEILEDNVGLAVRSERKRLERRRTMLINRRVRLLRRIELVNDVDSLRSHAHLRHE